MDLGACFTKGDQPPPNIQLVHMATTDGKKYNTLDEGDNNNLGEPVYGYERRFQNVTMRFVIIIVAICYYVWGIVVLTNSGDASNNYIPTFVLCGFCLFDILYFTACGAAPFRMGSTLECCKKNPYIEVFVRYCAGFIASTIYCGLYLDGFCKKHPDMKAIAIAYAVYNCFGLILCIAIS